jgi:predicted alpha/beta superfamily hydrolase
MGHADVAILTGGSAVVGLLLSWLMARVLIPATLPADLEPTAALACAEGERDRLQAVAKGMAGSSAAFLVTLLTALIQGKVSTKLDPTTLVGVLLGSIGMLLLAAVQSRTSSRYMVAAVAQYAPAQTAGDGAGW